MKKLLSLALAFTMVLGLSCAFGTDVKAASRYAVAARDYPADHYVTISSNAPVKGSTITAEKPNLSKDSLANLEMYGSVDKIGYKVYELYEWIYDDDGNYIDDDGKEFFYELNGKDSITHTVTKDCEYVYGAWTLKDSDFDFSNTIVWEREVVWGGLPNTSDYDIELSPVSTETETKPEETKPEESKPETTPAPAPAPSTTTQAGSTYTVKAGDSLSKIAKAVYNDTKLYMTIFNANKNILKDPNVIKVGQVLTIPALGNNAQSESKPAATEPAKPVAGTTYVVKKGDSLYKIAKNAYNNGNLYMTIFNANKDSIKNPSVIKVGQEIIIPEI